MEKNVKTKGDKRSKFRHFEVENSSLFLSFSVSFHENSITFQDCFKSCAEKFCSIKK